MAELSTLARPYAKAAFEFAAQAGELQGWSDSLATAGLLHSSPSVKLVEFAKRHCATASASVD